MAAPLALSTTASRRGALLAVAAAIFAGAAPASAQLTPSEQSIRAFVHQHHEDEIAMLADAVNINSGTMNFDGVRKVGALFTRALDSLGFDTRWVEMPDSVNRAGHLIATHNGKPGGTRLLLIGHFDTVFEGEGQQFVREDTIAKGAGSSDMKGGDVIMVFALKALRDAGRLKDANITIVFHGDEEAPGMPLAVSRRDLRQAAQQSDIADDSAVAPGPGRPCGCVRKLVGDLKPEYGEVLERVEVEGMPVKDFAASTGISASNAGVRVHRAREALRRKVVATCGDCSADGCRDCTCSH